MRELESDLDPHIAARLALGIVEFVKSPEGSARFAELAELDGYDPSIVDDLDRLAKMLLLVVDITRTTPRGLYRLFDTCYRRVAELGRELFVEDADALFPPLEALASREPPTRGAVAEVNLHSTSESNVWLGFSQDVADGGVFIATYSSHHVGEEMQLEVLLPGHDEPLRLAGVVQWVRPLGAGEDVPPGVGVRVIEMSVEAARALQTFARYRTPLFYDE